MCVVDVWSRNGEFGIFNVKSECGEGVGIREDVVVVVLGVLCFLDLVVVCCYDSCREV